jgi:HEAT repeat protein
VSFQSSIQHLLASNERLSASQLADLAGPDEIEMDQLRAAWPEIDPERRAKALTALAELLEDNVDLYFDPIFKVGLSDPEWEVRAAAIRGLYEYEGADLIPVLTGLLRDDPVPEVRAEAAIGLGKYALAVEFGKLTESDAHTVTSILTDKVEDVDEEEDVRARALESLGAISSDDVRDLIDSVYQEGTPELKVGAIDAMGRSCDEAWLPVVLQEMTAEEPELRYAAACAAGSIGDEEAIEDLRQLAMYDPDHEVQVAAVLALGEVAGQLARVALKDIQSHGDDALQDAVEEALREISFLDDPLKPF